MVEYIVLVLYFALMWVGVVQPAQGTAAEHIGGIIFTQFAGYFVILIAASMLIDESFTGSSPPLIATFVIAGVGGFVLMIVLTDDLVIAGIWLISTLNGLLSDFAAVFVRAILHGGWVMFSGFLAALVGSMAGVDPDALLSTHLGTVAGWGMLYYIGLLIAAIIMMRIGLKMSYDA